MFGTGFLTGLIAKVTGLGSVAKVALATATAALTMAAAGGAAGVLPFEGGHSGPTVTVATDPAGATGDTTSPTTASGESGVQAGAGASVATHTGSTSATTGAVGAADTSGTTIPPVSTPPVSVPGTGLPDLSGLAQVPGQVLACLSPIVDLVHGLPSVSPGQISQLGTTIVGCVSGIVANLPLPASMGTCASSILSFVRSIVSQLPTGTPSLGGFDVAACIPTGLPVPTGLAGGLPFMGGGFPFGH